jgi:DNA polymerase elongation subunit (family B)
VGAFLLLKLDTPMKKLIVLDCEIYRNYFLLSFFDPTTEKTINFERYESHDFDRAKLQRVMSSYTTVSFNGNNFDMPIIVAALAGWSNDKLKKLCDDIIKSNLPSWQITRRYGLEVPQNWDHIDIIEVAPGQSSLKIYGARLHCPTIQDLPIEPDAMISAEQRKTLRDYCVNDLRTTWALYKSLEKQIALRCSMSEQYGVDLRSKSDAQIAETVIKSELHRMTGRDYRKPEMADDVTFRYLDPKIISFQTQQLKDIFKTVLSIPFGLSANGSVKMPDELAKAQIKIGNSTYSLGIGGLHSCEKSQLVKADAQHELLDLDVASYYPSIILQQNLAPKSMGVPFLKVYQSIVTRRLEAKHRKDKVTADTLKICVNGSFGKLGSKWSALYAPDLMIQTTITGQLALLMLIESLELTGISVVSANTDGVVIRCPKSKSNELADIAFDWMLSTSYELERADYKLIASRDVNNYVAVKTDGEIKRKGVFADGGLSKNPDCNIVFTAVAEYLATGKAIESTVRECQDVRQFLTVRKVTGGAVWQGEYLGKAVRFYYSSVIPSDVNIEYAKNSNKVPKSDGARPMMTLSESLPTDIDYGRYIAAAKELLKDVGHA